MINHPQAPPRPRSGIIRLFGVCSLLLTTLLALPFYFAAETGRVTPLLRDPDLWWHMRDAQQLLETHRFIRADTYSFSVHGQPWVDAEWLAEIPYYLGYRTFGERGILFVMLYAMEAILVGVFALCYLRSRNFMSAYIATWVFMLLGSINFGPRTLLFGWICLTAEMILLELHEQGKDLLWLLSPLFAIWINLHGSWLIGLIFLFLYASCGLVEGSWGSIHATRWQPAQRRKLIAAGAASVLALFLNPYGWRLVLYPFYLLFQQKLALSVGDEFGSINFHLSNGKAVFVVLCALLLFAFWKRVSLPLSQVLFTLFAVYAGFTYIRFLFLIGICLCPIVSAVLVDLLPPGRDQQQQRPILNAALIVLVCAASWVRLPGAATLRDGRDRTFPAQAFSRLNTLDPDKRIFNAYAYGGYMEWAARDHLTFIDSRGDIFGDHGIFADYLKAINLQDTLAILDKYKIRYVFFPSEDPVVYLLKHNPGWKVEYDDGNAVILQRLPFSPGQPLIAGGRAHPGAE